VEERGARGNVLLCCCLLRHQEGKDEITPATLPLLTASLCAEPQHLGWLSHRAMLRCKQGRRKAFVVSFPVFFQSQNPPRSGAAGPAHSFTATRLPDQGGLLRKYHIWGRRPHPTAGSKPTAPSPRPCFSGGLVSFVPPSLFPQRCTLCVTATGVTLREPVTRCGRKEQCGTGKVSARESRFGGGLQSEANWDCVEHYHLHKIILISTKHF